MKRPQETAEQRAWRWWHLHGKGWTKEWGVSLVLLVLVVGGWLGIRYGTEHAISAMGSSRWWRTSPPASQYLVMGTLAEVLGIWCLRSRSRNRTRVHSFWDFRMFVGEIAMVLGGAVLLVKAAGLL